MSAGLATLLAAGDIMLGDSSHFLGRGVGATIGRHGPAYLLGAVAPLLEGADIFLANLESPVSRSAGTDSWTRVYRATPEALAGVRPARQNVLTVANNHILEHGADLLDETHGLLAEFGIGTAGFGPGDPNRLVAWEGVAAGRSVQVVAASLVPDIYGSRVDPEDVERDLLEMLANSRADHRLVSVHWGDEYVGMPSPGQVALGRRLIDAGATAVIGHHPHVLQPVEEYGGGLIAYSLGNFVFDQDWGPATRGGGLLRIAMGDRGIAGWEFQPTVCDAGGRPVPATGRQRDRLLAAVAGGEAPDEETYLRAVATRSREYRLRMKLELLRHFWRVTPDTLHLLATKRRRPRPVRRDTDPEGRA